jgi:hypothetical protein
VRSVRPAHQRNAVNRVACDKAIYQLLRPRTQYHPEVNAFKRWNTAVTMSVFIDNRWAQEQTLRSFYGPCGEGGYHLPREPSWRGAMSVPKKSLTTHTTVPKNLSREPTGSQSQGSQLTSPVKSNEGAGNTWMNVSRGDVEEQMAKYRQASNPPAQGLWTRLAKIFRGKAT